MEQYESKIKKDLIFNSFFTTTMPHTIFIAYLCIKFILHYNISKPYFTHVGVQYKNSRIKNKFFIEVQTKDCLYFGSPSFTDSFNV